MCADLFFVFADVDDTPFFTCCFCCEDEQMAFEGLANWGLENRLVVGNDGVDKVVHNYAIASTVCSTCVDFDGFGAQFRCVAVHGDDSMVSSVEDDFAFRHANLGHAPLNAIMPAHCERNMNTIFKLNLNDLGVDNVIVALVDAASEAVGHKQLPQMVFVADYAHLADIGLIRIRLEVEFGYIVGAGGCMGAAF